MIRLVEMAIVSIYSPPLLLPCWTHARYLDLGYRIRSLIIETNGSVQASMASPSSPEPTILSCSDSPLSTTASIVGILTFALGLLASYIALQSATRGAPTEIARLVNDLRTTQREINRVAEYIFDDAHNASVQPTKQFIGDTLRRYIIDSREAGAAPGITAQSVQGLYEVEDLLGDCVRLFYEADDLLKRCKSDVERWDPEGLRRRIIYVMNRHEVADKMRRLNDQKARLSDVRMSLFLRKSAMQDAMLKQVSESLKELETRHRTQDPSSDDSGISAP